MKSEKLYIIIPAYNEESNIEKVIDGWYSVIEKYNGDGESRLVVIDDGSLDGTHEAALTAAKSRPLVNVLKKSNGGHGETILLGYRMAVTERADFVFQTDSDGQTLPAEFDSFWQAREHADMIIGNRKKRGDGTARVLVSKVLKAIVKLRFGVTLDDVNTPFRLMKGEALKKCLDYVPNGFELPNVIIPVAAQKLGYKLKFLPITFLPRQGGKNSINMKRVFKIGKKALADFKVINNKLKSIKKV